jgi:hypothetical protein
VKNLFQFENLSTGDTPTGSPRLVPSNGGILRNLSKNFLKNDSINNSTNGMIDVVNGFYWTTSQQSSRQDVPYGMIKEKRLKSNALIAQLAYYSAIASEKGGTLLGRAANLISNSGAASGPLGGSLVNSAGRLFSGAGQKLVGAVSSFGKGFLGTGLLQTLTGKSAEGIIGSFTGELASSDVLSPYEGLYITEDTKFVYKFPYFENKLLDLSNAFSSDSSGITSTPVSQTFKAMESAVNEAIGLMGVMEPGVYIEKPKMFNFASGGDSVTFNFPLINTGWSTFEDVQKNWQLIYLLTYQNRPNRRTRDLIDPPCLYEVMLPGVKYMPYAFISRMSVNFLGSRRSYYIKIPSVGGGTSRIQTIIPDAYDISITFTSLIAESQNFLYHMLYENQNKVNVNDGPVGIVETFLNGLTRGMSNNSMSDVARRTNKETQ